MLDLNLNVSSDNHHIQVDDLAATMIDKAPDGSATRVDESGASNSSVVNADASSFAADEYDTCSDRTANDTLIATNLYPINSNILNGSYDGGNCVPDSNYVTMQLFPLNSSGGGCGDCSVQGHSSSVAMVTSNGIDLSLKEGGHTSGLQDVGSVPQQRQQPMKKSRRGPRSRSSQFRGVTYYRRTGRWESHIWDCGKQVYLGGFDTAHAAARAYDRAAIKFRGVDADINFNLSDYEEDTKQMKNMTKEEFVHILRRHSNGFSRGSSKYRGVTLHKCGRWEARMGQFLGKKAYDKAAIKYNGREAVTNFEPSTYQGDMVPDSNARGNGPNLDLNLGISTSAVASVSSPDKPPLQIGQYPLCSGTCIVQPVRRPRGENPAATRIDLPCKGVPMTSEPHTFWNSHLPNFFLNNEGMRGGEGIQTGFTGHPSWPWKIYSQESDSSMPLFAAAASSGFVTLGATAPSASANFHPGN